MKRLQPNLVFGDNREAALNCHARCPGGEIVMLQGYSESRLDVAEERGGPRLQRAVPK